MSHLSSLSRRSLQAWRSALGLVSVSLTACASLPAWIAPSRVELQAWLVDSVLTTRDTLRVRRTIANRGPRPIYLTWGSTDVSFTVRDTAGRPACVYTGVYTLAQVIVRVAPGGTTTHHLDWPLSWLSRCGPGRYTVHADEGYAHDVQGRRGYRRLEAPRLPLQIRQALTP